MVERLLFWLRLQAALRYDLHSIPRPFYFQPPDISGRIIAINIGGCAVPALVALYLLRKAPLLRLDADERRF